MRILLQCIHDLITYNLLDDEISAAAVSTWKKLLSNNFLYIKKFKNPKEDPHFDFSALQDPILKTSPSFI